MTTHDLRRELRQLGYPTKPISGDLYEIEGVWPPLITEHGLRVLHSAQYPRKAARRAWYARLWRLLCR